MGLALGAVAGLGRWIVGVVVLPVCGDVQRRRQHSATTAHRALSVCEWPALGMPWGIARPNASCVMFNKCGGACARGCSRVCRWFVVVAVFPMCGGVQRRALQSATTAHGAVPVCEWPVLGMPWGTARSNAP